MKPHNVSFFRLLAFFISAGLGFASVVYLSNKLVRSVKSAQTTGGTPQPAELPNYEKAPFVLITEDKTFPILFNSYEPMPVKFYANDPDVDLKPGLQAIAIFYTDDKPTYAEWVIVDSETLQTMRGYVYIAGRFVYEKVRIHKSR